MNDEQRPTKAALLRRIATARAALDNAISRLSLAQLAARRPGAWAVKDHLAHIAVWEIGVAALLHGLPRFDPMGVTDLVADRWDLDAINERIYRQHAELPASAVLTKFGDAHAQMLAALAGLSDEDLLRPYASYAAPGEPQPPTAAEDPVVNWIIGNTYEHFAEHEAYIRQMLPIDES
jgi:hypothetical protein